MKFFKCGRCHAPYKIDETKITRTMVEVTCTKCNAKNILRFGPVLITQSKEKVQQFCLKEGINSIGRKAQNSESEFLIEDKYVSRKHAVIHIEVKDKKLFYSIEDKGSLNGTFNKNKVKLKPGLKYPFLPDDYYIVGVTKLSLKII